MENFTIAMNAVMPFVIYIGYGYGFQKLHIVSDDAWSTINRFVFYGFFPFLTFNSVYSVREDYVFDWGFVLLCSVTLLVLIGILLLTVPRFVKENSKRPVVMQGIYRSNAILFSIPLSVSLFGEEAASLAGIAVTAIVPLYNAFAVILLEYYRGEDIPVLTLIKKILTNPIIDGAALGLLLHMWHVHLPVFVETPLKAIASASTPIALIVLGATLRFSSVARNLRLLLPCLFIKLIAVPGVALLIALMLGMDKMHLFVFFTLHAAPVAVSTFTMSATMGADGELASHFVMLSTVLSGFTLFVWIFCMKSLGII